MNAGLSSARLGSMRGSGRAVQSGSVTEELVAGLPEPVQRYLRFAGVVGRRIPSAVHLRQRGAMRLKPGAGWLPMTAAQCYTFDPPGFVWRGTVKLFGVWPVRARDRFVGGHGRMEVWPAPLLKIADARGPEVDQGELLRFLAELPWYPAAVVLPYLRWEAVDDRTARATMTVGSLRASALFEIAADGAIARVAAERYWTAGKGPARLVAWAGTHTNYREAAGVRVPTACTVTWHLPEGDYSYFRARVHDLVYEFQHGPQRDLKGDARV